jgi:hypothetical protein
MRYLILIHSNEAAETVWREGGEQRLDAAHAAVFQELAASGELVDGNELDTADVAVIGHHRGEVVTSRGPFTEGTEWVGGYYIVDVASRDRAVEIAGKLVEGEHSPIEIRRLMHEAPKA